MGALGALAGCAQRPQQVASAAPESRYDAKYGVASSPRVVADGQAVPKGGGKYHVGRPYQIAGKTYYPHEQTKPETGMASWYGADFHGRKTANGEIFDRSSITAAHPTMPLPSYARVTNLRNARSMIVRVNDRGPYHGGRVMDVSQRVAEALDFKGQGTTKLRIEYLGRAELGGSSDRKLMATLRTDGTPASLDGYPNPQPTAVAALPEPSRAPARRRHETAPAQNLQADEELAENLPPPPAAAAHRRVQSAAKATSAPHEAELVRTAYAPAPPARPLDLQTVPGAGTPIGAGKPQPLDGDEQ
ncbi:MAG: septal ring lytic transglycosylase RlpA family protein [Hyphomicrobiales bacterium]|nr:septal ring lytic transglycosylase RlpA family protein [Hyphomicrobiales bacterium]